MKFQSNLEAAIAYWYTTPTDENKWQHILQPYNQLILIEYSPITELNRIFAFAKVYGNKEAFELLEKLHLPENNHYHGIIRVFVCRLSGRVGKGNFTPNLSQHRT